MPDRTARAQGNASAKPAPSGQIVLTLVPEFTAITSEHKDEFDRDYLWATRS